MSNLLKTVFIFVLLFSVSCSEEIKPNAPDYYRIFTGQNKKTWRATKIVWTGSGKSNVTVTSDYLDICDRDNLYIFYANKDNLYEVTGGSSKCTANEEDLLVGDRWAFINATATLDIVLPFFSSSSLPFYVIKATTKEMTLEIFLDQDNKYSYQVTMQSISEE